MPPLISKMPFTGPAEFTASSDRGTALAWMFTMRPSAPMKIMSSGISVFFIQKLAGCGRS